jgi:EAL and modified HD-GYP domain-containing signal transduction protein
VTLFSTGTPSGTAVPVPAQPGERLPGAADLVRQVRFGRQGVYDARRSLVAYELQFHSRTAAGTETAAAQAASHVIASTFGSFGLDNISDGRQVFINVTRATSPA